MKRRVSRAHANKHSLRLISASHKLSLDGYSILCDASFLRAALVSYWDQFNPQRLQRKADKEKHRLKEQQQNHQQQPTGPLSSSLERTAEKPVASQRPAGAGDTHTKPYASFSSSETAQKVPTAASYVQQLIEEAFASVEGNALGNERRLLQGDGVGRAGGSSWHRGRMGGRGGGFRGSPSSSLFRGGSGWGGGQPSHPSSSASPPSSQSQASWPSSKKSAQLRLAYYCLPETVAALRRLIERHNAEATKKPGGAGNVESGSSSANSFSHRAQSLKVHRPSKAPPIPMEVVNQLLSAFKKIHPATAQQQQPPKSREESSGSHDVRGALPDTEEEKGVDVCTPSQVTRPGSEGTAVATASGPPTASSRRNEAKAIAEFVTVGCKSTTWLTTAMTPRLADATRSANAVIGTRGSKEEEEEEEGEVGSASAEKGGDAPSDGGGLASTSLPRNATHFFVATQSHDVRRLLPPDAALLRLALRPDCVWIERNGDAFHYTDATTVAGAVGSSLSSDRKGKRVRSATGGEASAKRTRAPSSSSSMTVSAAAAAAVKLSPADIAFMKYLGKADHLHLPSSSSPSPALSHTTTTTMRRDRNASQPFSSSSSSLGSRSAGTPSSEKREASATSTAPVASQNVKGKPKDSQYQLLSAPTSGSASSAATVVTTSLPKTASARHRGKRAAEHRPNPLSAKKKQRREVFRAD